MHLKRYDGINVVPFIDVMLVLLAIILTISTFIAQGKIQVDLPGARSAVASKEQPKSMQIAINKENKIFVDEVEMGLDELGARLSSLAPRDEVTILGDEASDFGRFIRIIDLLKLRAHENIQIITRKDDAK
jgi:biopolymer transport protein ExbD